MVWDIPSWQYVLADPSPTNSCPSVIKQMTVFEKEKSPNISLRMVVQGVLFATPQQQDLPECIILNIQQGDFPQAARRNLDEVQVIQTVQVT